MSAIVPEFLMDKIISEMYDITLSLTQILKKYGIQASGFSNCLHNFSSCMEKYERAQQFRAEVFSEEIITIADTDFDAQRARNRIMARQWYSSKMKPEKFGDKLALEVKTNVDLAEALQLARARRATIDSSGVQYAEFKHVQQAALTESKSVKSAEDEASELLLADILK